ncbi:ATP-binding protein [Herminiimonas contaminans]|uniref:ATP-binding protein n=1 Tax=Herminiimonas contaminans TaxID=1111140 RepID=A0ABS0EU17_9BURK|nr:ATP-binding protein [Herminiimonas contaminans]MBF8178038.1 ATP-binding protein [Herminiimonas contaminans]
MIDAFKAAYTETGVARFRGNPFIEALPPLEQKKDDFLTLLEHKPAIPTTEDRKGSEMARIMSLSVIGDVVHPFPEYQKAAIALSTMIREAYVSRNPLSVEDVQRRRAIASLEKDVPFPSDWKSSAKGHLFMAISGMGKTTFARAFLLRYPKVIEHVEYNGQPLRCMQIPYLMLRVPHDGTLGSLCMQFFEKVDFLLNTTYMQQARKLRTIASLVQLMHRVATAVSVGLIVFDEVQNLSNAQSEKAELMLNFFSDVVERLGISIVVIATPAVQSIFEKSVRNTRKLTSYGETILTPMLKGDLQWNQFCEIYWKYMYVKKKGKLTEEICDKWHDLSGGNTAFAALLFTLTQRNEIGGSEVVSVTTMERTAAKDMAFLQPAIAAMRSRDPNRLREFDDLLMGPRYIALRKLMGADDTISLGHELPDLEQVVAETKSRAVRARLQSEQFDDFLPVEDPLDR